MENTQDATRTSSRICHLHGDTFNACRGMAHPNRTQWCDGQGQKPEYAAGRGGICPACDKFITLRQDGTIRAHNGRGK